MKRSEEQAKQFLAELYQLGKKYGAKRISGSLRGETYAVVYIKMQDRAISPGELSNVMEISSARVAALLNGLEKKELILRESDPTDKRKSLVALTKKGQELAIYYQKFSLQVTASMLEQLGEEESENLIRIISKISVILEGTACRYLEEEKQE